MNTRRIFSQTMSIPALIIAGWLAASLVGCAKASDDQPLRIYTYDSFVSEWGPGAAIAAAFEAETGLKVEMVDTGDAGQTLARLMSESANPQADIVIGLDNHLLPKALAADVLLPYKPKNADLVAERLRLDADWHLTPFDYGTFAIIWDSEALAVPPRSLEDLTRPEYAKQLILMDPRSSTPGLGFLAWIHQIYGDGLADYWQRLSPSVLVMAPGWSAGYSLFENGEAPLVLSYTTSAAYHAEYGTAGRYQALEFAEGHPLQIEGVGIVRGTKRLSAARRFLDFVLTSGFQEHIPLNNWMYPVNQEIPLPASFSQAPEPQRSFMVAAEALEGLDRIALDALQAGQ